MIAGHIAMPVPKIAPMPPIDFVGPQGGMLAVSFAAGCIFTAALFAWFGQWFWKRFGDARIVALDETIKALGAEHKREIETERLRCDREIEQLRDRILQLETLLIASGPPALRNAVQAAVSEHRVATDRLEKELGQ